MWCVLQVFYWVFHLFPWNPLTKGVTDMAAATASPQDPGIKWKDLYTYCQYVPESSLQQPFDPNTQYRSYDCIFPLPQQYAVLIVQWAAYLLLAIYLNNVLPNEVGNKRVPWYFLTLSYWRPRPAAVRTALAAVLDQEKRWEEGGGGSRGRAVCGGVGGGGEGRG
jgi:hypothetical protein